MNLNPAQVSMERVGFRHAKHRGISGTKNTGEIKARERIRYAGNLLPLYTNTSQPGKKAQTFRDEPGNPGKTLRTHR